MYLLLLCLHIYGWIREFWQVMNALSGGDVWECVFLNWLTSEVTCWIVLEKPSGVWIERARILCREWQFLLMFCLASGAKSYLYEVENFKEWTRNIRDITIQQNKDIQSQGWWGSCLAKKMRNPTSGVCWLANSHAPISPPEIINWN